MLKAGIEFDAGTAYNGALPANTVNAPGWVEMPFEQQVVDLVQKIRRVDPEFAALPTGKQIDFVSQTVIPAVKRLPTQNIFQQFGAGIEQVANPLDYSPAQNPNSPATQYGSLLANVLGGIGSTVTGAAVGSVLPGPGTLLGGAAGAGTFAAAQRPAQVMRERALNFEPRNKRAEVEQAVKGAAVDYSAAGVSSFLPGGSTLIGKVFAGTAGGATVSAGANAAEQILSGQKFDPKQTIKAGISGAALGGVVPLGVELAPAVVKALRASATVRRQSAVQRGGRRAQRGFIGRNPDDVPGQLNLFTGEAIDAPTPTPEPVPETPQKAPTRTRQYNGQDTGEAVPIVSTRQAVEQASQVVAGAAERGELPSIQSAIDGHLAKGELTQAQALHIARTNFEGLSPVEQAEFLAKSKEFRSETGRALRAAQDDPAYQADKVRSEFIATIVEGGGKLKQDNVSGEEIEKAVAEAQKLIEESFQELFKLAASVFRQTVKKSQSGKRSPKKSTRTATPKSEKETTPKERKPREFKLRLKTVDEAKETERSIARQKRRVEKALEREQQKKQPRDKTVQQLKLKLGAIERREENVKRLLARAFAEDVDAPAKPRKDPTAGMSPEEKRTYLFAKNRLRDRKWLARQLRSQERTKKGMTLEERTLTEDERNLVRQKRELQKEQRLLRVKTVRENRKLTSSLDAVQKHQERLQRKAMAAIGVLERKLNPQLKLSLDVKRGVDRELQEALATLSPEMQQYYKDLYVEQAKAAFLKKMAPRPGKPRLLKPTVERLLEYKKHDVLNPDTLPQALKVAGDAHVIDSQDFKELNHLLDVLGNPGLAPNEQRRAEAQLQKFIFERKAVGLWAKYISTSYAGLLLQLRTQVRNYVSAVAYSALRLGPQNAIRNVADKAISLKTGRRTFSWRITAEARKFYEANEVTFRNELENIKYDLKEGTNTSRNLQGDVVAPNGLQRGFLTGKLDTYADRATRAITGTGDRLVYALAYERALLSEISVYQKLEGKLPDPKSDTYKVIRQRASNEAAQTAFTNSGLVAAGLQGVQGGITRLADKVVNKVRPLKKGETTDLGRLAIRFTTVVANVGTRVGETIPVLGGMGITVNRAYQAEVTNVPLDRQALAAEIIAAQTLGAALTTGGLGIGSRLAYDLGYYGAYIPGNAKTMSRAKKDTDDEVGASGNRLNVTGLFRAILSRNPEDLTPRSGDWLPTFQGYSPFNEIFLQSTALGAQDKANGKYNPGNLARTGEAIIAGLTAVGQKNDSFSGLMRPINTVTQARNKDTGEIDPLGTGVPKLLADAISFKIPGQDLIPQPVRDPSGLGETFLNTNIVGQQFVPEKVSITGGNKGKQPDIAIFQGEETTAGFLYALAEKTGKETHIMQSVTRTLKDDDGNKTIIPYRKRQEAQRVLNGWYSDLVRTVREAPRFDTLDARQQVSVLGRVKNDVIKAYMAVEFGKPIVEPSLSKEGTVDLKLDNGRGAKLLRVGGDEDGRYQGIIAEYIRNAAESSRSEERTLNLRQRMKTRNPRAYRRLTTGAE